MKLIALALALCLVTGCKPPAAEVAKASIEATEADATRLNAVALKACECTRKTKDQKFWEPIPADYTGSQEEVPPDCWKPFAEELKPFAFSMAPAAACGPGSDILQIILGPDRAAAAAMEPVTGPRKVYYVKLHDGFGTCTSAEFTTARSEFERANPAMRGCH